MHLLLEKFEQNEEYNDSTKKKEQQKILDERKNKDLKTMTNMRKF